MSELVPSTFRHPWTMEPLFVGDRGDLHHARGNVAFRNHEGSFDFVVDEESRTERAFYDTAYAEGGWWGTTAKQSLDMLDLEALWELEPQAPAYLKSFGDVVGKRILLIGNGTSVKELLFVRLGADVTFTDLSFQAVLYMKQRFMATAIAEERCDFHAVNAYNLPFADNTFDIICGDAVVHHLSDLSRFFSGVHRCLKPGGFCRFGDTGYSSVWQGAKKTLLRPLQKYSHRKHGISREDERATARGGFAQAEIEQLREELGFTGLYYRRVALLDYLLYRAKCKLKTPFILRLRPMAQLLDRTLAGTPIMNNQGISLVFGFDK